MMVRLNISLVEGLLMLVRWKFMVNGVYGVFIIFMFRMFWL